MFTLMVEAGPLNIGEDTVDTSTGAEAIASATATKKLRPQPQQKPEASHESVVRK
jgi:hypothetical protein